MGQGQHRDVPHVGERLAELGRRFVYLQPTAKGGFERIDRLLDQWLTFEIGERVVLSDPGQLASPAIGGFDHDLVADDARESAPIRLRGKRAALQDAGDDLPWIERPGDVQRHLDQLADVLLRLEG